MRKKNRRTSILGASGKRADGSRGSSCGMIALCNGEKRRCPEPPPEWMTCAPPQNRKTLVPDFAERHAKRLVLGFVKNAILKERDNEHQKMRRNGFYQVRNTRRRLLQYQENFRKFLCCRQTTLSILDGAMTTPATLLRQAGSGTVYPVALVSASQT